MCECESLYHVSVCVCVCVEGLLACIIDKALSLYLTYKYCSVDILITLKSGMDYSIDHVTLSDSSGRFTIVQMYIMEFGCETKIFEMYF